MSEEVIKKILETFVERVNALNDALTRLETRFESLQATDQQTLSKLDAIHLELRSLNSTLQALLSRK